MGPYRVIRLLGRTRHAEVWEAQGPAGHRVALKRTPAPAPSLLNEARTTARLHHPGVVQVLDLGEAGGHAYVVQELAPGGALPATAAASWAAARDVLASVLHALAEAHAAGILHLDIKPANLLCFDAPPRVRLADFGIARALGAAGGPVAGTLAWSAPEQLRGDALRPATDLYAVGCLGWLLLTGAPPHPGEGEAVAFAHQFAPLPAFAPVVAAPPGVEGWLRHLLEKDPLARPRLAADALGALAALDPALPDPPRRRRARPVGLVLGALRTPEVRGRHREKEALLARLDGLDHLVEVRLSGPRGCGKSALAAWLAGHAHATGAAVVAPMDQGLGPLVARLLDGGGLPPDRVEERLDEALATSEHLVPPDRAALRGLLADADALSPRERDALLPRLLRHHARGRPLVWLVEDQPVSPAVRGALAADPVLLVRTGRTPAPGDLALGPLPDEDATRLLEDLAPLAPAAVHRLVARGAGNPQLLVLLSQDPVLPGSLREAWRQRVLSLCPHPAALALAALLGRHVARAPWVAACGRLGLALPDLDPLLRAGLVAPTADGFRFASPLAREALLDHPDPAALRGAVAPELLARAARHVRTGAPTAAEALLDELPLDDLPVGLRSTACLLRADIARWRKAPALPWAERALALADTPAGRVRARHGLARALQQAGEVEAAAEARRAVLAEAGAHGLFDTLAVAATEAAMVLAREGRVATARAQVAEVQAHLPPAAAVPRASLVQIQAWLALRAGDLAAAVAHARAARPALEAAGERLKVYHCLTYEGDALRLLGDLPAASACFAEAVALCDAMGTEAGAIARVNQAIVLLHQGRVAEAGPVLARATGVFQRQGRTMMELAARLWSLAALEGADREACLGRIEVLVEAAPGRDPDLVEALAFVRARRDDPRLARVAAALA